MLNHISNLQSSGVVSSSSVAHLLHTGKLLSVAVPSSNERVKVCVCHQQVSLSPVGWLRGRALISTLLQHCLKREVHAMVQSVLEFVRAAGQHPFHPRRCATALAAVIAADSRTWASIWASSVRKQLFLSSLLHRILCFIAPCSVARVMVSFITLNTQKCPIYDVCNNT